jgi:ketosteroid isomerase-like protein
MPNLTPGDGQDVLARFKRAWEHRDVDTLVALFRDDAELRPDPFAPPMIGDVAIREHWTRAAASFGNIEFDAERIWVSGTTVLASWHGASTRRTTAERSRQRGFMTLELDESGSVVRMREWVASQVVGTDTTFKVEPDEGQGGSDGG